jgi:hypothetical protein
MGITFIGDDPTEARTLHLDEIRSEAYWVVASMKQGTYAWSNMDEAKFALDVVLNDTRKKNGSYHRMLKDWTWSMLTKMKAEQHG